MLLSLFSFLFCAISPRPGSFAFFVMLSGRPSFLNMYFYYVVFALNIQTESVLLFCVFDLQL
jgi:hypothetical protein